MLKNTQESSTIWTDIDLIAVMVDQLVNYIFNRSMVEYGRSMVTIATILCTIFQKGKQLNISEVIYVIDRVLNHKLLT